MRRCERCLKMKTGRDRETQAVFWRVFKRSLVIWMKSDNATGSRNADGNVPNVNWNADNGKLNVNWYNPRNANGNLRARAEVSGKAPVRGLFLLL